MKKLVALCCLWAGAICPASLPAGQITDMVEGLRERQYFDYALFYLDQLATNSNLPAEVRQEIPYEKAMVLLDNSKATRSPEKQTELLDQAQAYLEQFTKENPNHPRAGDANAQRAEILLGKARVAILQSRSPVNQGTRGDFQAKAREHVATARVVFEAAQKLYDEKLESLGSFVDKDKDPDKYEVRERTLMQLISSMLNVCQCRYEEAQTYDAGSPEFKRLLNQAAEEFELLHQRYRNYTGGLYARLYEGRCFDDQGDTQKAMGIYNELLEHDGSNRNVHKLQNVTLQFKIEALNRKTPPDTQVVIDLANEWLKANKTDSRSQVGLAIQWEQAVAYEALGDQREAIKSDKERNWRTARTAAQFINKFPSVYRDVSLTMIQRLDGKLGGRERKPEDFDAAFGLARQHFMSIQDLRKELDAARAQGKQPDEVRKIDQDLQTEMHDAAEMFQLALNLADKNDQPKSIASARLWLAYVHFWARRNYEAAILGDFVSRTAPKDESSLAIDAAYLAMAAYVQAYNDVKGPADHKAADLGFIVKTCDSLATRWPESDRANDARMMAGRMYSQAKKPVESAAWFSKVPEADTRYAEAQLAAGQAYWRGYLSAARLAPEQRPSADQLLQWQNSAQQHLRTGMAKLLATISTEGASPVDLISAKVSLSEILISVGQEAEAITVLSADPHSVLKAITVADETTRPEKGVQSRLFAVEVYKLLLRAYIGNGKLDEARTAMRTLEAIAGGGTAGADITELYVGLGKLLKDELERFRNSGNLDRFNSLRTSFETFLNDVYQRKDGHSVGTLSWVGETYSALGESDTGGVNAADFYAKAASAYQDIISQSKANPSFATADQLLPIKTRLAHCLRMKKDFSEAEKVVSELLKQRKDDLKLQVEAALLYRDWAGEPGEEKKYLLAISGNKENQTLGFGPLAKRIHGVLRSGKQSPEDRAALNARYLETRFQTSNTRYKYALAQKASKDKRHELDNAELEIVAFAAVTKDVSDESREQFNQLYRDVRTAMSDPNRPVKDLPWGEDIVVDPPSETARDEKPKEEGQKKPEPKPPVKPTNWALTYGLLGGGVFIGLGIVAWMIVRSKKPHKPVLKSKAVDKLSFDFGDIPAPKPRGAVTFPPPPASSRPAGTKTAAKSPAKAPATAPSAAPAAAAAPRPVKPKPKPPPAS